MTNYELMFTNPWLLFLLIPAIGCALIPYFLVQKKYRRNRNRIVSLVLHCTAITLAIFMLAGCTYSYDIPNKENELILLVDCSNSNDDAYADKEEFIQTVADLCGENYKLGIVKFGYDQVYAAQLSNDTEEVMQKYFTSPDPDVTATDVASALKYASTLFKSPTTSKIVLISDGIETDGEAMSAIKSVSAEGIKVDTVYYPNEKHDEVQIMSVTMPDYKINVGAEFTMKLVLRSNFGPSENNPGLDANLVNLTVYDNEEPSEPMSYIIQEGEQILEVTHKFDLPGMHKLKFEITNPMDTIESNNTYYSYINLEDLNNILLIEHRSGESQKLQELLTDSYSFNLTTFGIDTDADNLPKTVKELCQYEQVILVNIANSDMPAGFDEILYKYVNHFGGGLLTLGGENEEIDGKLVPHAYNSDDMANTLFADMLPVQAIDYTPPMAIMIVIDCSGSMSMGKLQQAQNGAKACLSLLGDNDYCGVMSFSTEAGEAIDVIPATQKDKIIRAIDEIDKNDGDGNGSGGTIFSTAIYNAGRALASVDVERRHIIIVSDGNPSDTLDEYKKYIEFNNQDNITMSIFGIQTDRSNVEQMQTACELGGGRFYDIPESEYNNLPTIMQEDIEKESINGIKYGEEFALKVKDHTAIFTGIDISSIPPLTGYYGTKLKDDESIVVPLMGKYVPIYAQWKFGEGTVGSFMCDLEGIWSEKFMNDPVGQALINNIVKNIFPSQAIKTDEIDAQLRQDNYSVQVSVSSSLKDGELVDLTINPLTYEAMDFYTDQIPVEVADGYSRFSFEITCPGMYEIIIDKKSANGDTLASLTLYYTFSYSQEYNYFPSKELMGEEYMAALATDGRGIVVEYAIDIFDAFDKYIHVVVDPRIGMLIATIILVLLDIAVRKFKFKWPHELVKEYKEKRAEKAKH